MRTIILIIAATALLTGCGAAQPAATTATETITERVRDTAYEADLDQRAFDLDQRERQLDAREQKLDRRERKLDEEAAVFSLDDLNPQERAALEGIQSAVEDPLDEYKKEMCDRQTTTADEMQLCLEHGLVPKP